MAWPTWYMSGLSSAATYSVHPLAVLELAADRFSWCDLVCPLSDRRRPSEVTDDTCRFFSSHRVSCLIASRLSLEYSCRKSLERSNTCFCSHAAPSWFRVRWPTHRSSFTLLPNVAEPRAM